MRAQNISPVITCHGAWGKGRCIFSPILLAFVYVAMCRWHLFRVMPCSHSPAHKLSYFSIGHDLKIIIHIYEGIW